MRLESHATPTAATPQQRYAALHRALERGIVSDAVWKELGDVSLTLGHADEAVRCAAQIRNDALRMMLESRLARHAQQQDEAAIRQQRPARPASTAHSHPTSKREPAAVKAPGSAAAPAASHAGTNSAPLARSNQILDAAEEEAGLRGHLVDAAQFLFFQHMPWLCLVTMLAFPIVIGLGGFLTSGTSAIALTAISALPGLCVCAVIFAMGRRILLESSRGTVDVPSIPDIRNLALEAVRFARDLLVVGLGIALPTAIAIVLGLSWVGIAPMLFCCLMAAPMGFCLRQLRGDSASFSPLLLGHALMRAGPSYFFVALTCWAMLLPLVGVVSYVIGQPIWLQIAAVGPTAVLPCFLAMRLLGTWIDANHDQLADVFGQQRRESPAHTSTTVRVGRQFSRPKTAPAATAATAKPATAKPKATAHTRQRPAPEQPPTANRPAVRKVAGRKPARTQRPQGTAQRPQGTAPRPQPAAQRPAEPHPVAASRQAANANRAPNRQPPQDGPDLSCLPGAVTVSGAERARSGAAARR